MEDNFFGTVQYIGLIFSHLDSCNCYSLSIFREYSNFQGVITLLVELI